MAGLFENRYVIWLLIVLALLSGAEFYLLQEQNNHKAKDYGHYPDSIGVQLTLLRYDATGFLTEIISAEKASHFPDTKTTLFNTLKMQMFNQQNTPPWLITSPAGISYGKGEELKALGAVHMQQEAFAGHPQTIIDTQNVTINTPQKYLTTEAAVAAHQPGLDIQAVGAKYDYSNQVLNLLHHVEVSYQPSNKAGAKK